MNVYSHDCIMIPFLCCCCCCAAAQYFVSVYHREYYYFVSYVTTLFFSLSSLLSNHYFDIFCNAQHQIHSELFRDLYVSVSLCVLLCVCVSVLFHHSFCVRCFFSSSINGVFARTSCSIYIVRRTESYYVHTRLKSARYLRHVSATWFWEANIENAANKENANEKRRKICNHKK